MAKEMVYFNATKQIETITIHYNEKLDGTFVEDVAKSIKDIAKKMSKVDLKTPREFDEIKVFVYPSKQLFYKVFGGEIEKRFYARRRSTEDLYVVQDAEGNIHIVSPRGMAQEKRDEFKKILVMKVLGEYMEEKEKQSALRLLKASMMPKEEEKEEIEEEEIEQDDEPEVEEEEQELEEEQEEEFDEPEEIGQDDELDIEELAEDEIEQDEIDEQGLNEIIEAEAAMEQIDESNQAEHQKDETKPEENKTLVKNEAQQWLSIGWLAFVRGRLKKEKDIKKFAESISKNGVKKLGQLSQGKWYEEYNYNEEYACAWVECIISTYGMKKFIQYYENPKDIKRIFGVSKYIFESQVKAYIKEKYKDNEKVLNITEDIKLEEIIEDKTQEKEKSQSITEIIALYFAPNGGVNITSDKEVEQPEIKEII